MEPAPLLRSISYPNNRLLFPTPPFQNPIIYTVNIIYNIADLVNKTAFGVAIWIGATMDSSK